MSVKSVIKQRRQRNSLDQSTMDKFFSSRQKIDSESALLEARAFRQLDNLRHRIAFYREYPDLFVDDMAGPESKFKFYFYQRIFLRVAMRHRYSYSTFPRAFSKSFLSMMILMIRCILYPNSHLFVTTGGKEQAASITIAKIEEICELIPGFKNEINWDRGETKKGKDSVVYKFRNGSTLDILAARESSRGQRRTGGLIEEAILVDGEILNTVIIPTTNVDRFLPDGTQNQSEVINKSQIYITTAGWKNSFAYKRLVELLVQSVIDPDEVMVMGGTYAIPVKEGLLNEDFVDQLRLQDTFSEESFEREYKSVWSGDAENAFFSSEDIEKNRVLKYAETKASSRKSDRYVLGIDVGRLGCMTEICVLKTNLHAAISNPTKSLVNIYTMGDKDFEEQAIKIKKIYYKYNCSGMSIDANGMGIGLIDFLTKAQVDPDTGETLPPFGVEGGNFENAAAPYKKIKGSGIEEDAIFLIKASAPFNSEVYNYTKIQIRQNKLKFLIDERSAKINLLQTKMGLKMSPAQRSEELKPYVLTTVLQNQMLNLVQDNDGINTILKRSSSSIMKDKFSALIYGMYYLKREEERYKKRRVRDISKLMLFN